MRTRTRLGIGVHVILTNEKEFFKAIEFYTSNKIDVCIRHFCNSGSQFEVDIYTIKQKISGDITPIFSKYSVDELLYGLVDVIRYETYK